MVIISTNADEVRIQAVSPLSTCGSGVEGSGVGTDELGAGAFADGLSSCAAHSDGNDHASNKSISRALSCRFTAHLP